MEPIAVIAALLRNQIPDVTLREGSTLMARVASRGEGRAVIVIAGVPVMAKLPPEIPVGATLKLQVQEASAERLTLRIVPRQPGAAGPVAQPEPEGPATYAPPGGQAGRPVPGQPGGEGGPAGAGQAGGAGSAGSSRATGATGSSHSTGPAGAAGATRPAGSTR